MSPPIRADRRTSFLLPPSIDEWVPKDDPVRLVAEVIAQTDLRALGFKDADPLSAGAPAFGCDLLLSVWMYGYMRRIRSTRQLEVACRERMPLLWLTGMNYPDHNTLWRFFRTYRVEIRSVFRTVLLTAERAGLVGMVVHALDGTKLQAACSTETACHRPGLEQQLARLNETIEKIEEQISDTESKETGDLRLPEQLADANARREQVQRTLRQLAEHEKSHLHPTEPEATVVGLRGGGFRLGYNAQAVADENQLIVAEHVEAQPTDYALLTPMLDQVVHNLGERPEQTVVDAGYVSARHLADAQSHAHRVVVPEPSLVHSQHDEGDPFHKSRFTYDSKREGYVCPRGELLPLERLTRSRKGHADLQVYRCHNQDCPVRGACTKDSAGRTIRRAPDEHAIHIQRAQQQADPESAELYRRRKAIIEPVFAVIKAIDGFRRFTMRGLTSVRAQWSLVCTAYNLRKIYRAWRTNRRIDEPATA